MFSPKTTTKKLSRSALYNTPDYRDLAYTQRQSDRHRDFTLATQTRLSKLLGVKIVRKVYFRRDISWLAANWKLPAVRNAFAQIRYNPEDQDSPTPISQLYSLLPQLGSLDTPKAYVMPILREAGEHRPKCAISTTRKLPNLYSAAKQKQNPLDFAALPWEMQRIRQVAEEGMSFLTTRNLQFTCPQSLNWPDILRSHKVIYERRGISPLDFYNLKLKTTNHRAILFSNKILNACQMDRTHNPFGPDKEPVAPLTLPPLHEGRQNPPVILKDHEPTPFTKIVQGRGFCLSSQTPPSNFANRPVIGAALTLWHTDEHLSPVYSDLAGFHMTVLTRQADLERFLTLICKLNDFPSFYQPWNGVEDEFGQTRIRNQAAVLYPRALLRLLFMPVELHTRNDFALPWGLLNALMNPSLQDGFINLMLSDTRYAELFLELKEQERWLTLDDLDWLARRICSMEGYF